MLNPVTSILSSVGSNHGREPTAAVNTVTTVTSVVSELTSRVDSEGGTEVNEPTQS